MTPIEAAARFAAFAWYSKARNNGDPAKRSKAEEFARDNWAAFVPMANEGWGRLLLRLAKQDATRRSRTKRARRAAIA